MTNEFCCWYFHIRRRYTENEGPFLLAGLSPSYLSVYVTVSSNSTLIKSSTVPDCGNDNQSIWIITNDRESESE